MSVGSTLYSFSASGNTSGIPGLTEIPIATIPPLTVTNGNVLIGVAAMSTLLTSGSFAPLILRFYDVSNNLLATTLLDMVVTNDNNGYLMNVCRSFNPSLFTSAVTVKVLVFAGPESEDWALVAVIYDKSIGLVNASSNVSQSLSGIGLSQDTSTPSDPSIFGIGTFNNGFGPGAPGRLVDPYWSFTIVTAGLYSTNTTAATLSSSTSDALAELSANSYQPAQPDGILHIGDKTQGNLLVQLWVYDPPLLMTLNPGNNPPNPIFQFTPILGTITLYQTSDFIGYGSILPTYPKGRPSAQFLS